ncbi:hypothetical protein Dimus_002125 [Dionaea muscipula]
MAVLMDNVSEISSQERAQRLYNKNVELRRRAAQAKTHDHHNLWCQIRDNYEAIVLEDHDFAEQHEVELELWQFHYKRIEELRALFSAANITGSAMGQNVKGGPACPDRVAKIRSQFKTFLSEATGFYHQFMMNIREKYGLQQSIFSDNQENQIVVSKDGNKSVDLNKGLISCHRCLIYLGDLARYKGLYGEGESKMRDFTAASSYYKQASWLWPSHGNPHHQLAIVVFYSGDEYVAIYHYFRSLAVETPFLTARENLVIAFEKNRQSYSQLLADLKTSSAKLMTGRMAGKGRGRGDSRLPQRENKVDGNYIKDKAPTLADRLRAFTVKFVRLNGILFTRTSLETFADVLSMARNDFVELLSSGAKEQHNFGSDPAECGLFIIRLVAILIFTVYNLNQNQPYADILPCSVLRQHACTAVFEFMGHMLGRCVQLCDTLSSYMLPGLLIFVEWLACHPDIAAGKEAEEKYADARSFFWKNCILFLNKLLLTGLMSSDEDETCFFDMSRYEDGETNNRIALWEDFELRGFLPLQPAQQILEFSRKCPFANEGSKEKKTRLQRIIGAGKACANVVRLGQQTLYFDSKLKKFDIGAEPLISCDYVPSGTEVPCTNGSEQGLPKKVDQIVVQRTTQLFINEEDEEEVIVFKPSVADKHTEVLGSPLSPKCPGSVINRTDLGVSLESVSESPDPIFVQNSVIPSSRPTSSLPNGTSQHMQPIQPSASSWLHEPPTSIMNGFDKFNLMETGHATCLKPRESIGSFRHAGLPLPFPDNINLGEGSLYPAQIPQNGLPSRFDAIMSSGIGFQTTSWNSISNLPTLPRKTPVSRPVRQIGPPPGFTPVPLKNADGPLYGLKFDDDTLLMDDYSWLDGYQMPSSTQGVGFKTLPKFTGQALDGVSKTSSTTGVVTFPFPGKQYSVLRDPVDNTHVWQDSRLSEHMKLYQEQSPQHLFRKDNQQLLSLPQQCQGQSLWEGHFLV